MRKNYKYLLLLLMVSACSGAEDQKIDTESVKSSPLLVPPCHQPLNTADLK